MEEHIADAVSKGASVLLGGGAHGAGPLFFEPTVLSGTFFLSPIGIEPIPLQMFNINFKISREKIIWRCF